MAVRKGTFRNALASGKGKASKPKGTKSTLSLEQILDRPHGDTRPLSPEHVAELEDSIAAVGLIQPLAIDSKGHLLAGGHRRAALVQLQTDDPARYAELFSDGVPVRRFAFSAADEAEQAIAIEAAENEKRRDYTPAEVRDLADRLVEAGYKDTEGRPRKGAKQLTPALMTIVGKSRRTVKRYLANDSDETVPTGTVSKWEKAARTLDKLADDPEAQTIARTLRNAAKKLRGLERRNP